MVLLVLHGKRLDTTALPGQLKSPMIEKAVEVLSMMSQTPVERERYEARLKAQRDYSSGLKEARLEGRLEALEKLLQSKFGSSAQPFVERFRKMVDLEDLRKAFDILLAAQSLEEFRETMAKLPWKSN
jgi:hypothetical protein